MSTVMWFLTAYALYLNVSKHLVMFRAKSKLFDFLRSPSSPWTRSIVISAAGVISSGWTNDNKVFLYSSDGYSVSNPQTGDIEIRNRDQDSESEGNFSKDNLEFTIDELGQTIKVFGLRGGNGNHLTSDSWTLGSFHPSLTDQIIGIRNLRDKTDNTDYWRIFQLVRLTRLEYFALTYGFSPNEKHFGIFGSGGAEIFTRE